MPNGYSLSLNIKRYEARAKECLRLASRAADPVVGMELFKLRQNFLDVADEFRQLRGGSMPAAWQARGLQDDRATP